MRIALPLLALIVVASGIAAQKTASVPLPPPTAPPPAQTQTPVQQQLQADMLALSNKQQLDMKELQLIEDLRDTQRQIAEKQAQYAAASKAPAAALPTKAPSPAVKAPDPKK